MQQKGLARGAPSSSVLSEIFLQYLESTQIIDVLISNSILGYFRYWRKISDNTEDEGAPLASPFCCI
jgi:hypothetical protein